MGSTSDNLSQAYIAKSKLEAYGISCFLEDENIISLNLLYNQAIGGIKLRILEKDYETAIEILNEEFNLPEEEEKNEIICPNCQSNNVSFGPATKNKFSVLTLIVSFLFFVYPFYSRKRYHCFDCGCEFKKTTK
jgi:DNA-directed RNA polymerase subunit RPC12/RpoP